MLRFVEAGVYCVARPFLPPLFLPPDHGVSLKLKEFNNTGNTNTTIEETVEITERKTVTGKDYTKEVHERASEEAKK